ncbi:hypothetical protein HpVa146_04860 [Helicobacter pylori]
MIKEITKALVRINNNVKINNENIQQSNADIYTITAKVVLLENRLKKLQKEVAKLTTLKNKQKNPLLTRGLLYFKKQTEPNYTTICLFCYNLAMSMDNKNTDEVNIIQEYKKIYDECDVESKIKVLGNIQKYQMDMLKFYP